MVGKVFLIIGARGSGKSTIVKRHLKNIHPDRQFIFDVQNEYGLNDFAELPDIEEFLDMVIPLYNSVIVYEEATAFFSSRGSNRKIRKNLVDARHHQNVIYAIFHSIRSVPNDFFDLCDYVYLLHTNDTTQNVKQKNELLVEPFERVMSKPRTPYPDIVYELIDMNKIQLKFWNP